MMMTDKEFKRLSEYIQAEFGIKLPPSKKQLLVSRLAKRLRILNIGTYKEYCDYLFSDEGMEKEIVSMIDLVTTNKTDFFRENDHFDYLVNTAIPELVRNDGAGVRKPLMAWSAGCSTGEEPYTLAMVLNEFALSYPGLGFDYTVLATDLSSRVVEAAAKGIYSSDRLSPVPDELKRRYFLKSKDQAKGLVRVAPELRARVRFRRLNFMERDFGFREYMDIIFCRNVFIYFDRQTQEKIIARLLGHMRTGSFLFIGHSETLNAGNYPLARVAPSVYKKMS